MLYTFREGDKVMQIKNNYDIIWHKDGENGTGIFNGDIGYLRAINRQTQEVVAEFDGRRATYPFEQLDQLELAYAVTVQQLGGYTALLPLAGTTLQSLHRRAGKGRLNPALARGITRNAVFANQ